MTTFPLTLTHWGAYRMRHVPGGATEALPFENDPDPSSLGRSMAGAWNSQARILRPAVRQGYLKYGPGAGVRGKEPFVEVPWELAVELVSGELTRVTKAFGSEAIFGGSYGWSSAGRFHHAQGQLHRFLNCAGGYTSSVNTYSVAAGEVILPHVLGLDPQDMMYNGMQPSWKDMAENAELVVAFGGMSMKNRQVGAGGPVRHLASSAVKSISDAGVRFVNVSFTRDDAPPLDKMTHFAVRPCTDVPLMLALAHTIIVEGLFDEQFVARCTVGFDEFLPYLMGVSDGIPKDAAWASGVCGCSAGSIRALARDMARSRTLITAAMSLQRQEHGEQTWWMAVVLAALLGQIGLPGRGIGFGYASLSPVGNDETPTAWPHLPQGLNAVKTFIPVARMADMLLNPGGHHQYNGRELTFPDIRLVWWAGGNPFHHHQDLNRLIKAWQKPETVIAHEVFWNAHARHADIVLPATTALERNDLGCAHLDPHLIAMKQMSEPLGEAQSDYAILTQIARAVGIADEYTEGRNEAEWLRYLYKQLEHSPALGGKTIPSFDEFWDQGWLEVPFDRAGQRERLGEALRRDPDANPLDTPSGRIEIFSSTIDGFGYADCPGHPMWLEPLEWPGADIAARFPLYLSSNQPAHRLHSQYDQGVVSVDAKVEGRERIRLSIQDAAERSIENGMIVRVFNDRGACLAAAWVDEGLEAGVVQLPTGAWYFPSVSDTGPIESHGNPNVLTADRPTSRLAAGPSINALVQVEAWTYPLPDLAPFEAPQFVVPRTFPANAWARRTGLAPLSVIPSSRQP
ncbi:MULTISPECIES: molybdopterin guanine dinucleotide-containing S/N-oxide reductase [unclassified Nocardioides]|uniref:molybdopterin guanine dinucleotide-containing S/N-oxide reductase n=1 Tax=unclassified Nocardioides TaxID=2615069 RepID=UPI0000465734|nr:MULTISPECIES: molybdopterin guanine dinucleotide-containing S/N-oxide reductase [unclassified Nocardioides]AAV52091.1 putative dimethylsulfoxide reductase [Nocardioides sp. JS614]ABL79385.1 molybdopterin oxidoreductase [Nocardioides sp. JS614]